MLKAPRLPTRQTGMDGRHHCCLRVTLVLIACLILTSAALLAVLLFDERILIPVWMWSSVGVPAFSGVMLLVLVLMSSRGVGCRAVLILAAVSVFLCSSAFCCNLLGILKHTNIAETSLQNSDWVWNGSFSDCRLSQSWPVAACECVHVMVHQRVEMQLCELYDRHMSVNTRLNWLRIAFYTTAGISLVAALITGHVMLHACFRPRLGRLNHSAPNNYTAPTIEVTNSLPRTESGAYEHIDSLISSSYMDPIRLPVLSELNSFIAKRQQPLVEEPELEVHETALTELRHLTLQAKSAYDSAPSDSDSELFKTV